MIRRRMTPLLAALLVLAAVPASGYLKLGTQLDTRVVTLRWADFPIRYFVTDRSSSGVTAQQFQTTITRAFETWDAVETADTSMEFAGFTNASPRLGDGANTLGFVSRPDLEKVLGATNFLIDITTGEIVESDIFFNTRFTWSVASAGETGRHDLESIALHEIGHLLGLGHSAIGETEIVPGGRRVLGAEAVMFPIAFAPGSTADRTLKADDIAGLTDIYPTTLSRRRLGSITGRVLLNGRGVFGAHVVAYDPSTGALVGGFTLNEDGTFTIAGLTPGPYILRVEPLDDGDIESFFDESLGVQVDFRARFLDRLVVVPRGGGARNVEIVVRAK